MRMNMKHLLRLAFLVLPAAIAIFSLTSPLPSRSQGKNSSSDASSDPILRALRAELARSKAQLKMDNVSAPFYIEYRVFDVDQFEAGAAFGALFVLPALLGSTTATEPWLIAPPAILIGRLNVFPQSVERANAICVLLGFPASSSLSSRPLPPPPSSPLSLLLVVPPKAV